ncbi:MAG: 4Fe-4S dicluster domain-containing protein [Pseudomonadota bacterium]
MTDIAAETAAHKPIIAGPVYPQSVKGPIRTRKTIVLIALLALYYILPFLRWDRGPSAPDQAVLLDFASGHFYFFFLELWIQDLILAAGLMIASAVGLFFVSTLYGRVWCGFTCPQTLWTDLFMFVERWIEGDRNARMRLDADPHAPGRLQKKILKHAVWILISVLTGGAFIFYFNDAPTTFVAIFDGTAPLSVHFFGILFTAFTYLLAGYAREKVCTYMCPWPRFQAALLDKDSMVVSYQPWRGEPRGKRNLALRADLLNFAGGDSAAVADAPPRAEGAGCGAAESGPLAFTRGDCIDCGLCVHVCPTGVDIREGLQLSCIGCGLCVDACNGVMEKIDRPKGLIRFDSENALEARAAGRVPDRRPIWGRARVWVYAVLFVGLISAIGAGYVNKGDAAMAVLHDRQPLFVRLTDGSVRNAYTLRVTNKTNDAMTLELVVDGLPPAVQTSIRNQDGPRLELAPGAVASKRVFLVAPRGAVPLGQTPVTFMLVDPATGAATQTAESYFWGPK